MGHWVTTRGRNKACHSTALYLHGHKAATGLEQAEGFLEGLGAVLTVEAGLHVEGSVKELLLQALDLQVVLDLVVAALLHVRRQLGGNLACALHLNNAGRGQSVVSVEHGGEGGLWCQVAPPGAR